MDDHLREQRDIVMNEIAGRAAVAVQAAAQTLHAAGIVETSQAVVRTLAGDAARATTARAAGAQLLRTATRAGAIGLVVDAIFGAVEGLLAYQRGEMTGEQACEHVLVEASTGAVSTSAGVMLAACAVTLTGGLPGAALMAIGAGGAVAAKLGLVRMLDEPTAEPADTTD
ncbi:hypothetical protein [Nannocystis punicea]|uniref:Uncharacterized protein n=1 Tax=Nannocystis punicea TaxID=2995304 RepID=A0ABY7HC07_9BACT|nr:hypothetical protein [Nannocystis poenicansa]WAS96635.1 hypothetical protein O0S08_10815 [Nannocystis poenicansa]